MHAFDASDLPCVPLQSRARRLRREWIIRPGMLRVPPSQFFLYFRIPVLPETGEISRNLLRTIVWPEQVQQHGHTPTGNPRRFAYAEHFLNPHGQDWRLSDFVRDRMPIS